MTLPVIFDRTIKPYILILASIFAVSFLTGSLAPVPLQKEANEAFKFLVDTFQGLSGGALFFYILSHNLMASILILASGMFFGFIPILSIGANGFLLGVSYRQVAEGIGYSKVAAIVKDRRLSREQSTTSFRRCLALTCLGLTVGVTPISEKYFPMRENVSSDRYST